jgi:hypothetical protein
MFGYERLCTSGTSCCWTVVELGEESSLVKQLRLVDSRLKTNNRLSNSSIELDLHNQVGGRFGSPVDLPIDWLTWQRCVLLGSRRGGGGTTSSSLGRAIVTVQADDDEVGDDDDDDGEAVKEELMMVRRRRDCAVNGNCNRGGSGGAFSLSVNSK